MTYMPTKQTKLADGRTIFHDDSVVISEAGVVTRYVAGDVADTGDAMVWQKVRKESKRPYVEGLITGFLWCAILITLWVRL